MSEPELPLGETVFVTIRVDHSEQAIVELTNPEIAGVLRNRSEKVKTVLAEHRQRTNLSRFEVLQLIRSLVRVFEIPTLVDATALRTVLKNDPDGLRLSYIDPGQICMRWAGFSKSVALETANAAPEANKSGRGPGSGAAVSLAGPEMIRRAVDAVMSEQRDSVSRQQFERETVAMKRSLAELAARVDELLTRMTLDVGGVKAEMTAEIDRLAAELARVKDGVERTSVAGGGHGAAARDPFDERMVEAWVVRHGEYLGYFDKVITRVPAGPEREKLESLEADYRAKVDVVRSALESKRLFPLALDAMTSMSDASLRDTVVALIDLGSVAPRMELDGLEPAFHHLEQMTGLEPIEPKPGDRLDVTMHTFEPQGIASEHPRGTVARVLTRGYLHDGKPFRRARVEISKGPSE